MKKLYKANDPVVFGVCGGIAKYIDTDAESIRFLFVIATLVFPVTLLLYVAMAMIMPDEPEIPAFPETKNADPKPMHETKKPAADVAAPAAKPGKSRTKKAESPAKSDQAGDKPKKARKPRPKKPKDQGDAKPA